ncbi:MAG: hypothetical protein QOH63_1987 [Acidobacteriota bacterium]|jgi:hypothetical protein|nr:hypothetical protein [Acidobacteriota bacterium]
MAVISNQDLTKIMRGFPVRVFLDLTFNADGTVKNLAVDGTIVSADHANGVELGFTQDGAEITLNQTRGGLEVDQRNHEVLPILNKQEPHLKLGYLQVNDFATLAKLVPGASVQTDSYATGISDQVDQSITLHSITAIAPTAADKTKFHQLTVYACSNMAALALKLSKAWHKMPVDFVGEDAGRTDGKTYYAGIITPVAP